jgi:hypothetical protein
MYRCLDDSCAGYVTDITEGTLFKLGHCGSRVAICRICHGPTELVKDHLEVPAAKLAESIDDDIYNEVVEWGRMRDVIDEAELSLRAICQEVGASVIEAKISAACRNLQDIIHKHHGLGD